MALDQVSLTEVPKIRLLIILLVHPVIHVVRIHQLGIVKIRSHLHGLVATLHLNWSSDILVTCKEKWF